MITNKETRNFNQEISYRQAESGEHFIEGYGAVFNQRSRIIVENGKKFYEVIRPYAFDKILATNPNVIACVDHDKNKMLGRTRSGTLALVKDGKGLKYMINIPNTALGNDIVEQIKRGDYFESSFAFGTFKADVKWGRAEDGIAIRYVENISALMDVSIVRNGAYANTDIALRQLAEFEGSKTTTSNRDERMVDLIATNPKPTEEIELPNYNICKAIRELGFGGRDSLTGTELATQQEALKLGLRTTGLLIPPSVINYREGINSTTGLKLIHENTASDLDIIVPRPIYKQLGCRIMDNLRGKLGLLHKEHTKAVWYENEEEPIITNDHLVDKPLKAITEPTRIGITDIFPKELLMNINPEVFNSIISDMVAGIDTTITKTVLDTIKQHPDILNYNSGNTPQALTGMLLTMLEAQIEPNGIFVMNRDVFAKGKVTNNGTRTQQILTGHFSRGKTFDDYPAIGTSLMGGTKTDSSLIYGDFYRAIVGLWRGVEILIDPYTYQRHGLVEITVNRLCDIVIRNPKAFVKCTKIDSTL
ncbi:HK97 family phage prohead protease [Marinifilum sp. D737]|uniref:HK97 family phage prohead protease n=1 Tax=Marinifilum sp. D737 TaxID=2969628 RepID=UPI002274A71C|nr:HK97 family phage prohead protease [Marinifilum sp. D737]MCY1635068.1 HK97 family phage prohead protease [Marinifilum sp. D737]